MSGKSRGSSVFIVGNQYQTNEGCTIKIVEYINHKSVLVEFQDEFGHIASVSPCKIRSGGIKNPFFRSVQGVGYMGVGKYKSCYDYKRPLEYLVWKGMMARCYDSKTISRNPTYIGCTVSEEWHDFQNFAEWYTNHRFYGMGYELDKDILFAGNKIYSPETCTLVPAVINCLLIMPDSENKESKLPKGVVTHKNSKKYLARVRMSKKQRTPISLGSFDKKEDAHRAYVLAKTDYVKSLIGIYDGKIEASVINALHTWCEKEVKDMEDYCSEQLLRETE